MTGFHVATEMDVRRARICGVRDARDANLTVHNCPYSPQRLGEFAAWRNAFCDERDAMRSKRKSTWSDPHREKADANDLLRRST